jgi:cellulose biosynthesis protein BcsQ
MAKKIVCFANYKGGCGKTTLAFHVVCRASHHGISTLAITLDPQGSLVKRLVEDVALSGDNYYKVDEYVDALSSPNEYDIDEDEDEHDLIVVDFPPAFKDCDLVVPDLWIVPVDCREAVEGLMTARPEMQIRAGGVGIYAVMNKYDTAGRMTIKKAQEAISMMKGVKEWSYQIPTSGTIQRSNEYYSPTWALAVGHGTKGDQIMIQFCDDVLELLGFLRKGRRR